MKTAPTAPCAGDLLALLREVVDRVSERERAIPMSERRTILGTASGVPSDSRERLEAAAEVEKQKAIARRAELTASAYDVEFGDLAIPAKTQQAPA